jgi:trigger factor
MVKPATTPSPIDVEVSVEEMPRSRRRLALRVAPQVVESVRAKHLHALARRTRLKGFRPGKAPLELVEKRFAEAIEHDLLDDLVRSGYEAGVRQSGLDPVAPPTISEAHWAGDGALEFSAEVDVRPVVELARTRGFRIERPARAIGDADVERVIERLRHERADWPDVDRAAAIGDRVAFDSVPLDDGGAALEAERIANHVVELGSGTLVPDFEAGLVGRKAGEEATIDVTFPDDHPNPALRGRARRFRIVTHAVKERVLPPLDDSFARTLGEFSDVAALREQIRANLEQDLAEQSEREIHEALIDEIIAANPIELPEALVDRYLGGMMADRSGPLGQVPEERRADLGEILRPGAERALKRYYILQRVAEIEKLDATETDLGAVIAERATAMGLTADELRRRLAKSGELEDLRHHLTMERVFTWLRENSQITEA